MPAPKLNTLTIPVYSISLIVEFYFTKGCHGLRDSFQGKAGTGPQLTPDEPDEYEITGVYITTGSKPTNILNLLSDDVLQLIERRLKDIRLEGKRCSC